MNFVESYFTIETFSRILTLGIFVIAGFDLSKYMPQPKSIYAWMVLVLLAIVAGYVGIHVSLVMIFGFGVYLNMVLLGLCCGFIAGFLFRLFPRFRVH